MIREHLRRAVPTTLLCVVCATLGAHCSGPAPTEKTELDAPGTAAVPAQGWVTLKMNGYNYADTELDPYGHFKTVPNGCHQDAAGAISVALWNQIGGALNKAVTLPVLSDQAEICFDRPTDSKLYGTVDLVLDPSTAPRANIAIAPAPTPTVTATGTPTSTPTTTPTPIPTVTPSSSPTPSPSLAKRTVLEDRGNQICTTIKDAQLARNLVTALDQLADIAYKEDCERVP